MDTNQVSWGWSTSDYLALCGLYWARLRAANLSVPLANPRPRL